MNGDALTSSTAERIPTARAAVPAGLIDCDFPGPQAGLEVVGAYLPRAWREYLQIGQKRKLSGSLSLESTFRDPRGALEAPTPEGDPRPEVRARLDRRGISRAVIHPGFAAALSGLANERLAAQVASAANDWLIEEWLAYDQRFLGSVLIAPRDAARAAAEIRRVGAHPQIVQVVLAYPPVLLGNIAMHKVFDAASEYGLAVQLQAGGAFTGVSRGIAAVGHPTSRFEYEVAWTYGGAPHLLSAVAGGLFETFPNLKLVLSGFGIVWLPSLMWAMDMEFVHARVRRPKRLNRLPSEYVADHVRFTTTLIEIPTDTSQLVALLSTIHADRLLVIGSNYPSSTHDDILHLLPEDWRPSVHSQNARELFGLELDQS